MTMQAATAASRSKGRPRPRFFYSGVAILFAAVVVLGFARTYYLKEFFGTPALPSLLHVHGVVMTAWLALLIVQSTLVAAGRTDIHRRLGVAGGILAVAMVGIGLAVAIRGARLGHSPIGTSPLAFLVVPFGDIFVFAVLVAAALYYRRRPQLHKRLMLVGTIAILPAGIARWPFAFVAHRPAMFFGITDLLLLACIAYDYANTRRVNPAFLWGGMLLIASHPLRFMLAGTSTWMAFAHWVTGV